MSYEHLTLPYWTTRDYERLRQLLGDRNEIVCFVDYRYPDSQPPFSRDVCSARCFADDDYIRISARGIQYNDPLTHVNDSVRFIADCKRMNLEFIDPEPNHQSEIERVTQERDELSEEMTNCHHMLDLELDEYEEGTVSIETLETRLRRYLHGSDD